MLTVLSCQSVFDLAIQTAGSAEAAFAMAVKNGISITDIVEAGRQLETVAIINRDIAAYYSNKMLKPATADRYEPVPDTENRGIGEMAIEINFMVNKENVIHNSSGLLIFNS